MTLSEYKTRLPPLTALRAFDAAVRHMSFAKAAEELFVTPAALSYQIKQLESHFNQPLFRRLNRAVELNEAGRALAPGAAEGFAAFRAAAQAVTRLAEDRALTITAGPAFTAKWLAPRFFRFAEAHPEIELRFVASLRILDFDRDGVDAAIRYTTHVDESLYSEVLARDWHVPLCAPGIAESVSAPADLARLPLLHDASLAHTGVPLGWPEWFSAAGEGQLDGRRGVRFSNADHALDAAVAGAGVALGRLHLAERDIAAGRLVAPLPMAIGRNSSYRFVCPLGAESSPVVGVLIAWMREEMRSVNSLLERFSLVNIA